ncbi:MAG: hypothetical protein IPL71_20960 [Anaerolineales bacterium]|uniref:hypothetical protein n=1 Tax=Candidatus Villigracilis proximus TaxID=3140683 RepID=UPI003135C421|nr:hypothetical protein [Anaerolineales bacterium]
MVLRFFGRNSDRRSGDPHLDLVHGSLAGCGVGWLADQPKRIVYWLVFPTTLLLAFVINYTGKEIEILWLHLGLLLFLLGLTGFSEQMSRWNLSKTDYSESTSVDTLVVVVVLTITLTAFSSFASSVSIKELIDRMREKREQTTSATQGEALGLEPVRAMRILPASQAACPVSIWSQADLNFRGNW